MNKRQKKKHFKKIYGMNPKQYEKWMQEEQPLLVERMTERIREGFERFGEMVIEAAQIFSDNMAAWAEEIKAAAGFQETEKMLRKSNTLPEGADKELLKHIGIRMDRYGWAYDFYYDEANEEYFVETLQEGGTKDDAVDDVFESDRDELSDNNSTDGTDHSNCLPGSSREELN